MLLILEMLQSTAVVWVIGGRGAGEGEQRCLVLLPIGSLQGCSLTLPCSSFKIRLRPSFTPFQRSPICYQ